MTYDESPVEVQYERCKQAMEILRNNVKDAQTMAAIDDAYKNCQENGATQWNVGQLRLTIIETNAMRGYDEFCPLDEVTSLFD
ncbi:hypothetical protein [Intestinibaculum porci]|jgi:hypothetical protein|uniref:hypothetical protein n=1 Tax=Intestinibaculum porci TaxID=2487118 RepID=UPI0024093D9F|nr:hypothetical protein [Intestinibaculum porci]MDD6348669.1 hypothetical protein [Intestinibaculum porci]MDD6422391.1 hypothetical protein [Intestinibaculum porci]